MTPLLKWECKGTKNEERERWEGMILHIWELWLEERGRERFAVKE